MNSITKADCGWPVALAAWLALAGALTAQPSSSKAPISGLVGKYCFDCHADGSKKGNVSFDTFKSDDELVSKHDLWHAVLKNTRANIMPPAKKPRPTAEEQPPPGE